MTVPSPAWSVDAAAEVGEGGESGEPASERAAGGVNATGVRPAFGPDVWAHVETTTAAPMRTTDLKAVARSGIGM